MSTIPEIILHRTLVTGLREVRKDPRLLDALFKNLDQPTLQAMKDFITKESIHFTLNYPRADALHTPAIAILLKNEQEAQTFLGDYLGSSSTGVHDVPDQELAIDTLGGHGASTSDLSGLPPKVVGPLKVASATYNDETDITNVVIHSDNWIDLASISKPVPNSDLYVIHGAGSGQVGTILTFREDSLDIHGYFDPQLDNTSLVDIRLSNAPELAVGEPSRVYPRNATNLVKKGANYDVQYQLSVIAGHQDQVLYLYSIVKGILFSQKNFMESQGVMALKISGSDFAPRTDFLPQEVFQRVMILNFTYVFSYIEEIEVFDQININVSANEDCQALTFDVVID